MGQALSRATGSTAVKHVPAAAHKSEAIAQAAVARAVAAQQQQQAFPPTPAVPASSGLTPPPPVDEEAANRGMAALLNQTSFVTRAQPTGGATSTDALAEADALAPAGVKLDTLIEALRLHGEDPRRWDAPSLARRYGIADEQLLADSLAHCRTYRVVEDEEGRPKALAIGEEMRSRRTTDLFAEFEEVAPTPPSPTRALPGGTGTLGS